MLLRLLVAASVHPTGEEIVINILWGIALLVFVLWALGFAMHIGGGLIHLLLVVALVSVVVRLVMGSRVTTG